MTTSGPLPQKNKKHLTKGGSRLSQTVRLQKVERPTNRSFYVNFPVAIAEATKLQKGELMEWLVEDRNTFILRRVRPRKSFLGKE